MPARPRFAVASVDGSPVYYELSQPPTGATELLPLVLSNGIGCDGFIWKYLAPALADHQVLHWHYRGHGRTPAPRDPNRLSIPDLADDLAAVLDDADVSEAVLFGHSMGVQVCLEAYRRHPQRVRGLVLVCGAPSHPLRTFRGSDLLERVLPALRKTVAHAPGLFAGAWRRVVPTNLAYEFARLTEINKDLIDRDDVMPYLEGVSKIDPELFLTMLDYASVHSADDLLPRIDVPTLIVAGDRDGFTPAELSHRMHSAIPGSELLIVEDGSHTAPLERPQLVERHVRLFLDRLQERE